MKFLLRAQLKTGRALLNRGKDSTLACVLTWVWGWVGGGGICVLNQGLSPGKPGTAVVTGRETAL